MIFSIEAYEGGTDSFHPCFSNVGESGGGLTCAEGDDILVSTGTPGTDEGGVVLGPAFFFVESDLLIFLMPSFANWAPVITTSNTPRRSKGSLAVPLYSRCLCGRNTPSSQKG